MHHKYAQYSRATFITELRSIGYITYIINIFRCVQTLYRRCPSLEGTKDALCHKFRRLTIGQNCRAVCTNESGHRDAFVKEWCEARAARFERPAPSLERSERQGLFFVMPVNSLVVDSTFEQSENVAIVRFLVVSSSSCCWPAVRGVAYTII